MSRLLVDEIRNSSDVPIFTNLNNSLELFAGDVDRVPLDFQPGTLATTPVVGAMEYDGTVFYNTPTAGNRALTPSEFLIVLTGTNTLASQTGAQPIFDGGGGPAGGAITLPVGTYEFECQFALTNLSGTSGGFGFSLVGTATRTEAWTSLATKGNNTLSNTSNAAISFNTTANTNITGNTTNTAGIAICKGIIRVTVAGTIVPQVSMSVASAAVVQTNSFFKCKPVGASGFVSLGPWS